MKYKYTFETDRIENCLQCPLAYDSCRCSLNDKINWDTTFSDLDVAEDCPLEGKAVK